MNGPLSGIKVVELATFVAGPVTARLMADMGAEVIKIEAPSGDGWRTYGINYVSSRFSNDENPVFDIYNTGKKHISLNLKTPQGLETMHRLLAQADVFITNTRPAALKRLGIAYEDIKDKYPQLVYAIVLGYGEKGPDADKPAYDNTAFWSRTGFLLDLSPQTSAYSPMSPPFTTGDTTTGYLLLSEISTALFNRTRTGRGDYVSSTLFHNGIFCAGTMAIITQKPFGRKYPSSRVDLGIPDGAYECSDGEWIFVALGDETLTIPLYCKMIGRDDLGNDPIMESSNRWANRQQIYDIFKNAFLTKPASHWLKLAEVEDLPVVRMNHFSDISEDPQAWENGFVEHVQFRSGNVDVMPTSPIEMESCTPPKTVPAPINGSDSISILEALGYSAEEIAEMTANGSVITA